MPNAARDLIGSADVCAILRINRSTLSRWVAAGKLTPAQQLPGQTGAFLFQRDDIERLAPEPAVAVAG